MAKTTAARAPLAHAMSRGAAARMLERLCQQHPNAFTELAFSSPFELLVATVLSAQSTDARVNSVTPQLFARYPTPATLASAGLDVVEDLVKPTGFFRTKARAIVGLSQALVERHDGQVPASLDALVALPGVGRKTANVVLGHAFGVPALPVDRHVMRVSLRLGLSDGRTPEQVEADLSRLIAPEHWTLASDTLILHGRRVCRPTPLCERCAVNDRCPFLRSIAQRPPTSAERKAGGA